MTYITLEPSPTALLFQIVEHNAQSWEPLRENDYIVQNVEHELTDIWLPLFKSRETLSISLERLALAFNEQPEADLCQFYLCVLKGLKNEDF
jgi:hypothetical protein